MKNNIMDYITAFHHIRRGYESSKDKWFLYTAFVYIAVIAIFIIGCFVPVKFGPTKTSAFIIAVLGVSIVVIIKTYIDFLLQIQLLSRALFVVLFRIDECWKIENASKEENQEVYISFIYAKLLPIIDYAKSKLGVNICAK